MKRTSLSGMRPVLAGVVLSLAAAGVVSTPVPALAAPFGPAPERLSSVTTAGHGVVLNNKLYFVGADDQHGRELWVTDGTRAGTRMVRDIQSGVEGSVTSQPVVFRGKVWFQADDGTHGQELWSSDGTQAGTTMVGDFATGGTDFAPEDLTVAGSRLYFTAFTGNTGRELWSTGGTAATTQMALDMRPGDDDGDIGPLTAFGSRVLFGAEREEGISKPWVSGGTEITTARLDDPAVWGGADLHVGAFAALGDRAVFVAGDDRSNAELWVTRGVVGDAAGLRDIEPGGVQSYVSGLTRLGDEVLFSACRTADGCELWTTDGTVGGTQQLRDVADRMHDSSDPRGLTASGSQVFFSADDHVHGEELWVTSGTVASTRLVRDLAVGGADGVRLDDESSAPVAGGLFFVGRDDGAGKEPWFSDGTSAGTRRIADLTPGIGDSAPTALGVVGSTVVFETHTGNTGLWGYTVTPSRTIAPVAAPFPRTQANRRRIVLPVRVVATGARPTGTVVLTKGSRVIGRATVVNGVARVRVAIRLAKGRHRVVAHYSGSTAARASVSRVFLVRVR